MVSFSADAAVTLSANAAVRGEVNHVQWRYLGIWPRSAREMGHMH
jgi:hypothetical protein